MMEKKYNWPLIGIVFLFTVVILFGGFTIFEKYWIIKPINEKVQSNKEVNMKKIETEHGNIDIQVSFQGSHDPKRTYYELIKSLETISKGYKIQVEVENDDNKLTSIWGKYYFMISQALENKEYSLIPKTLENMRKNSEIDEVGYTMDDQYIFIDIHKDNYSNYYVLSKWKPEEVEM